MRAPWSAEPACCLHSSTSLAFDSVSQATGACPLDRGAKWDLKRKAVARLLERTGMWWEAPSQSVPEIRRWQAEVQESKGK